MYGKIKQHLINELEQIRSSGLFKDERILAGRQGATVELTDGSSQAYLKELVFRAVQVSMEDEDDEDTIRLRNDHFEIAHDEMTSSGEKATGAIIGFRVHHGQNRLHKDAAVRRKAK